MALLPVTTASATIEKSSLCKAYNAEVKQQKKGSVALGKEMASGSWSSMQKVLLGTFDKEANVEKQFATLLSGASAKVKSAITVALQLDNTFRSIIQHSTSLAQFQSGITAAESTPKVKAAEKVLVNYTKGLCD
jgi:enterochelin esterase-like enzyme